MAAQADIFAINHIGNGTMQIRANTREAVVQANVLLFVPPQPGNPVAPPFEIYELVKARNGIAQLRVNGMFLDYNANQNPNNPIQIDLAAAVWPIYELTKFVFIPI